jgi:hypothetical protein
MTAARSVSEIVNQFIERGDAFSSRDIAEEARVSRQAVHKHLTVFVDAGRLVVSGKARAVRYAKVVPLRQRVEVASAGSLFRLSARLLLLDVKAGEVTLDFTGVIELGDEFLDEVFLQWAPKRPWVQLKVERLPAKLAPGFFAFAKKVASARARIAV